MPAERWGRLSESSLVERANRAGTQDGSESRPPPFGSFPIFRQVVGVVGRCLGQAEFCELARTTPAAGHGGFGGVAGGSGNVGRAFEISGPSDREMARVQGELFARIHVTSEASESGAEATVFWMTSGFPCARRGEKFAGLKVPARSQNGPSRRSRRCLGADLPQQPPTAAPHGKSQIQSDAGAGQRRGRPARLQPARDPTGPIDVRSGEKPVHAWRWVAHPIDGIASI